MDSISLEVTPRKNDVRARDLRAEGRIPGVLYGFETDNQPFDCDYQTFHKTYVAAGESTVIDLKVGSKTVPVLVHALDLDPVTGDYQHIDFYAINMKKAVTTHVPIHTTGESSAVKNFSGILVTGKSDVTVTCLPKDLPHFIEVDLGLLENLGDTITVADLNVKDAVTIDEREDEVLFTVEEPRTVAVDEEEEAEGEEGEATEEGEEKKEGEEEAKQE